jgi:hypothetical protein
MRRSRQQHRPGEVRFDATLSAEQERLLTIGSVHGTIWDGE